jgi:tetratricopeptide (TPR) repeat protein
MQVFYPDMVGAIDLAKEDARLSKVDFSKEAAVRTVKVTAPEPPPLTGAAKVLDDAEQAYAAKDYERAKQTYLNLLQQTDGKAIHAKAYYGLARIAARQNDPESADRLFKKTLEMDPEPQDKAWTLVYLGKLAMAAAQSDEKQGEAARADRDRDQAQQYFQEALKVSGASHAAMAEAQKSLQGISKP